MILDMLQPSPQRRPTLEQARDRLAAWIIGGFILLAAIVAGIIIAIG